MSDVRRPTADVRPPTSDLRPPTADVSGGTLVAMYHYVRPAAPGAGVNALPLPEFEAQLDWLGRTRRVVSFREFEAALNARRPLDGTALLTFDDGFIEHYDTVYPRLRARGCTGVFFVAGATLDDPRRVLNVHKTHLLMAALGVPAFAAAVRAALARQPVAAAAGAERRPEAYRYDAGDDGQVKHLLNYELPHEVSDAVLTALFAEHVGEEHDVAQRLYLPLAAIREMAHGGMVFGFHTEHHRMLSRLSPADQLAELQAGVTRIKELTGQTSVPFCYPYGHPHTYDAHTLAALAACGYSAAFNTVRRTAHTAADPRYELPRLDTRDFPPFGGSSIK